MLGGFFKSRKGKTSSENDNGKRVPGTNKWTEEHKKVPYTEAETANSVLNPKPEPKKNENKDSNSTISFSFGCHGCGGCGCGGDCGGGCS